ncbi:MAG: helix-turn-helix transcriptional regulator [Alteromonadaceae bacterium]|nr:helix-turn-helix transcriptional regulator [Alteromonadaceae bacterium]
MTEFTLNQLTIIQCLILALTLSLLTVQLLVAKKQTMHLLFAIFCGSVAIATSQKLAGDSLGAWRYLIGMGACATCNIYWLLARTMFRESAAINMHHVGFATLLGMLMLIQQGYWFVDSVWSVNAPLQNTVSGILNEAITMLSSVVLIMAVWEGLRGYGSVSREQKTQRVVYLFVLASAICTTKFVAIRYAGHPETVALVISYVTLCVIFVTQLLLFWIAKTTKAGAETDTSRLVASHTAPATPLADNHYLRDNDEDIQLATHISDFLDENYLQANLKVADVARALNVSEYRISRVLKQHYQAKNFNHYINRIRIEHARKLLADPASKGWSVLVVGLESGFASVGPFTRAFKQFTGVTPAQYRQQQLS